MSARTTNAEHCDHVPGPADIQRIRNVLAERYAVTDGLDGLIFERNQHLQFVALLTPADTVNDMLATVVCLAEFFDSCSDASDGGEPTIWERDRRQAMDTGFGSLARALVKAGADPNLAGTYPALLGPPADDMPMILAMDPPKGAS